MVLSADHIEKSFGERRLIRDASFHIDDKDKYALVGINGVGKTTLLRLLVGEEDVDSGRVILGKDADFGYLPQQLGYHSDKTIFDELYEVRQDILDQEAELKRLEQEISEKASGSEEYDALLDKYHRLQTDFELKDGYSYKARVLGIINGLGFSGTAKDQVINTLSGGQKTRVALGKLLITSPKLLILDEPTNHLDISSTEWLESYLSSYPGAVLIVSHDRYFLDRFVDHVLELDAGTLRLFKGNYTDYISQKEIINISLMHSYEKQQAEIKHQEAVITKLKQFNREKSIRRAESREKMLDKIERIDKPVTEAHTMNLSLSAGNTSGNDVLSTQDLGKCFGDHLLFSGTSIDIKRGENVAIIGDNGTGKTTLLKMINGTEPLSCGTISIGTGVVMGYYDQEHGILDDNKTIFDELHDEYPDLDNTQIRNTLAAFLFIGDDVFKPISSLSGGEKGRVSLAKLMLSESNLLLLDEPTNHLDMLSREILENAIREYDGTLLCVSHDRYFIDRTATRVLELYNKHFYDFKGGYSYYLEKKDTVHGLTSSENSISQGDSKSSGSSGVHSLTDTHGSTPASSKEVWLAEKEKETKKRRIQKEYDETEARIEELENSISEIEEKMLSPELVTDYTALNELASKKETLESELADSMDHWESLAESLEEL
ncbi:MAG: ABC-F family ATP-binding cassette domain-containing protein [Eubacterium sp.]|nr:ABC-F family ATP-binding cassette domain-containing protein [Eubacterium sp.]